MDRIVVPLILYLFFSSFQLGTHGRFVVPEQGTVKQGSIQNAGSTDIIDILREYNISEQFFTGDGNTQIEIESIRTINCEELRNELTRKSTQLLERKASHIVLQRQVFDLQKELAELKLTCKSEATTKYSGLPHQLETKIRQLDDTVDAKLTLTVIALSNRLGALRRLIHLTTSESAKTDLQNKLFKTENQLNLKLSQLQTSNNNFNLVLKLIRIQTAISEEMNRTGDGRTSEETAAALKDLREDINKVKNWNSNDLNLVLQILTLQHEIRHLEQNIAHQSLISVTRTKDLRKKQQEMYQLLKEKINLLNEDDTNAALTEEIYQLQHDLIAVQRLLSEHNQTTITRINVLKTDLKNCRDLLETTTTQLKQTDTRNAEQILELISLLYEIVEFYKDTSYQTTEGETQIIIFQERLQALETENGLVRQDNTQLRNNLTLVREQNSLLWEKYNKLQTQWNRTIIEQEKNCQDNFRVEYQRKINSLQEEYSRLTTSHTELQHQFKEVETQYSQLLEEHTRLESKLEENKEKCAQHQYEDLNSKLNKALNELDGKSEEISKLILNIWMLNSTIESLKKQIESSEAREKITELEQKLITKEKELKEKNEELEQKSANPQKFLKIIAIQKEIWRLQKSDDNEVNLELIEELQAELGGLISEIKGKENDYAKLMLQIVDLQNQLAHITKLKEALKQKDAAEIAGLERQLQDVRNQFKEKIAEITLSKITNLGLTTDVKNLQNGINELERQLANLKRKSEAQIKDYDKQLEQKNNNIKAYVAQLKEINGENANLTLTILDLHKKIGAIENKETEVNQEKDKRVNDLTTEVSLLKENNRKLQTRYDEILISTRIKNDECSLLEERLKYLTAENNRQQEQLQEEADARKKLEAQIIKLKNNLQAQKDEVIQFSKITINPDTAHPKLKISEDGKEIITLKVRQNLPDNSERFNIWPAALGSTGFSSGRQYWEIGVTGKSCFVIGVTRDEAERKGPFQLKPKNGYWTMGLIRSGDYKVFGDRVFIIDLKTRPQKIGVLLDFKKGEVSFYNPDLRSHIYTFTGQTFQGLLYPFLTNCLDVTETSDPPLVLISVSSLSWLN